MNTQKRVLILGFGEMGRAMQTLLGARARVVVWQRRDVDAAQTLAHAAATSDVIVFCLPTRAHDELSREIGAHVRRATTCVSVAKGLDAAGRTAVEVFNATLAGRCEFGFLYGPMIAEELQRSRMGFADVSASSAAARASLHALFANSALILHDSDDAIGGSWCAVLKNLYAVLFGCVDELALGDNLRGHLAVTAIDELTRLLPQLGGKGATAQRWAGLGDLITTATSANSHHRTLGQKIARGDHATLSGEAVNTVASLQRHLRFDLSTLPLLQVAIDCILQPATSPSELPATLMRIARDPQCAITRSSHL